MLDVPKTSRGCNYCNLILDGATTEEKLPLLLGGRAFQGKGQTDLR